MNNIKLQPVKYYLFTRQTRICIEYYCITKEKSNFGFECEMLATMVQRGKIHKKKKKHWARTNGIHH